MIFLSYLKMDKLRAVRQFYLYVKSKEKNWSKRIESLPQT